MAQTVSREQDYYKQVANTLIERLKAGTPPWSESWTSVNAFPMNPTTGKRYRGCNLLNLMMQGHQDPRWMTFKQADSLGASVKKGEHGTPIIFWKFEEKQQAYREDGTLERDEQGRLVKVDVRLERPRPFISTIFNAEQIEGLPPLVACERKWNPEEKLEAILVASGATFDVSPNYSPAYLPRKDQIQMPRPEQFKNEEAFYSTILHELAHWTGHETRMNREDMYQPHGSAARAMEELRAEIASVIIYGEVGLHNVDLDDHAAYVGSWVKALKDDPKEIFRAAADAERITDYIMGLERHVEQQVTQEAVVQQETHPEPPLVAQEQPRQYLNAPYAEKEEVKALGAKWDRQEKAWYVPSGVDESAFAAWLPDNIHEEEREKSERLSSPAVEHPKESRTVEDAKAPTVAGGIKDSARQYLAVPYEDRHRARDAGALWDSVAKSWYMGPSADTDKLNKWLPGNRPEQLPAMQPREEFTEVLRSLGFHVDGEHPVMDGKPHRIEAEDDHGGEKAGFYVGHLDGRPAGYAKNNRTGDEARWKSSGPMPSLQDQEAFRNVCEIQRQERENQLKEQHLKTAQRLSYQMSNLASVTEPSPYMEAKGIQVHKGALQGENGTICLPAMDVQGTVWSMQYVNADGTKRYAKESQKEGCFHPVDGMEQVLRAPALVICEGYATASSVAEAVGFATIAAFDSANVVAVAKALHEKYPDKPIVIAGDDDRAIKLNTGRIHAEQAAREVGGCAVFPTFAPHETGRDFTDFNDLATKSIFGAEAIKRQVMPVVAQAVRLKQDETLQHQQNRQSTRTA